MPETPDDAASFSAGGRPLRVAFLGTGPFAVPSFEALLASRHEVVGLVTQPDRTGRGHHRHINPLKVAAEAAGIAVLQPTNINDDDSRAALEALQPQLLLTASYGQFLGRRVRELAPLGAINLHASLLPKYRGAAPVQHAVWNREPLSGVTVFQIERGMDTGPVLATIERSVAPDESAASLFGRLAEAAAEVALTTLDDLSHGRVVALPQDHAAATLAPKLTKADGRLDWSQPAERVRGQILATQPWPKPTTTWHPRESEPRDLLILAATPVDELALPDESESAGIPLQFTPGLVLRADDQLVVACGDGRLRIDRVQPPGKAAMPAAAFLNGTPIQPGDRFGQ